MEYLFDFDSIFWDILFVVQFLMYIVIMATIIKVIILSFKRSSNKTYFKENVIVCNTKEEKKRYVDIKEAELSTFQTTDLDAFKDYFYKIFYDFEMAYNNLDYGTMKLLSTKQLYQNYYTGIILDLKKGEKRIIKDVSREDVIIFETISTTTKQAVSAVITISYIDYVENKDGKVLRGNRDLKVTEHFEVIFRKDFGKEEPVNCPNCGAPVNGNKCDFCRTAITEVDFKISSIKKILNF